jgi:hypothetical protein
MKLYLIIIFSALSIFGQEYTHRWKPLVIDEKEKIWYDQSMVDSTRGSRIDIWILQMYKPPLTFEGISGEVYRSKTLFTIDLKTVKYGIRDVVYYDVTNKEIQNFHYDIDKYPDNIKYSYPIMENSFLFTFIKEIYGKSGETSN